MRLVPIERLPGKLEGQVVRPLSVFDGGVLVVSFWNRINHHVLGLVDRDGIRRTPGALLAVITESAMQRADGFFASERFEEATVAGKGCRGDGELSDTDQMPFSGALIFDPSTDEGVRFWGGLPNARNHGVPSVPLDKRPDMSPGSTAATFSAVIVFDE